MRGRTRHAGFVLIIERTHAPHQAALPRRSRRQPAALRRAEGGAASERGEIGDALQAVEDREIAALIEAEAVGLRSITDGEYRRASWRPISSPPSTG
jgi:hypothetical protein